ncbi:hypothetical protein WR25_10931 [Diploscapter pachys]|uniref:Uncharacterized protein n=1 Tax=Diploscapter pachys TaxID=2018661 RepID=A0A2A2K7X1_9BILA|nr:hypothetical protein WR25_10931 [Diploscapter pachys]
MVDSCDVESRSGKVIPEYSLRERALCAYHHVLNYNSQRIPSSITEVECSCDSIRSSQHESLFDYHCEPMYYNMRVMIFSDDCQTYVEHIERVALACLPVLRNQIPSTESTVVHSKGTSATVHI